MRLKARLLDGDQQDPLEAQSLAKTPHGLGPLVQTFQLRHLAFTWPRETH